ncbi:MAG: hypothetical protein ACREVY_18210 [Gammaproteobacteria bacterium]
MIGPELYSFRALWRHYRNCRRNKRNTFNALAFEADAEAKLLVLQQELRTHSYRPGRSIGFITAGPKPREVFAADFCDRTMNDWLYNLPVAWMAAAMRPVAAKYYMSDEELATERRIAHEGGLESRRNRERL